jgi:RNA polymerase sigma factor (sigma-70 family)
MTKLNEEATEIAIGVAKALCREYEVPPGEWDDCMQEGVFAALSAVRTWRGESQLSTFLYRRVRGAIMDYRSKQQNGGTGGRDAKVNVVSLHDEVHGTEDFDGEPLTYEDITSYDNPPRGYGDPIEELILDEEEAGMPENILERLICSLSEADRVLIKRYFGIDGPEVGQQELAFEEDVSQAAVSKRIQRILSRLAERAVALGYKL